MIKLSNYYFTKFEFFKCSIIHCKKKKRKIPKYYYLNTKRAYF